MNAAKHAARRRQCHSSSDDDDDDASHQESRRQRVHVSRSPAPPSLASLVHTYHEEDAWTVLQSFLGARELGNLTATSRALCGADTRATFFAGVELTLLCSRA